MSPACPVTHCDLPPISSQPGALCMSHYQYVYRTAGDPEDFVPRSKRSPAIRDQAAPREQAAAPRRVKHHFCHCGEMIWTARSYFCLPHAEEARLAGAIPERTGLCAVPSCPRRSRRDVGICTQHHVRAVKYGLTIERAIQAFGVEVPCDSCGDIGQVHVDHDHSCCPGKTTCGKCVRGMLCASCNLALGQARDDRARLLALVAYLDRCADRSGYLPRED